MGPMVKFFTLLVVLTAIGAGSVVHAFSGAKVADSSDVDPTTCVPGYWSKDMNTKDQQAYYGTLSTSPTFADLSRLVTKTHVHVYSYSEARRTWLYPCVDRHPDGSIVGIYTNKTLTQPAIFYKKTFADGKYNCEHTVPQSWFQSKPPMVSDLHHLFSAEVACNGFRSNYRFGAGGNQINGRDGCGGVFTDGQDDYFTPDHGRGSVARASLYFILRYPTATTAVSNIKKAFQTLVQWSNASPPTEWERHRNAAIYRAQGNRNPFIDFPELVSDLDWNIPVNSPSSSGNAPWSGSSPSWH